MTDPAIASNGVFEVSHLVRLATSLAVVMAILASPTASPASGPCRVPQDGRKIHATPTTLVYRASESRVIACWRANGERAVLGRTYPPVRVGGNYLAYSTIDQIRIVGPTLAFNYQAQPSGNDRDGPYQNQVIIIDLRRGARRYCVEQRPGEIKRLTIRPDGVAAWLWGTHLTLHDGQGTQVLRDGYPDVATRIRLGQQRLIWNERGGSRSHVLAAGPPASSGCARQLYQRP